MMEGRRLSSEGGSGADFGVVERLRELRDAQADSAQGEITFPIAPDEGASDTTQRSAAESAAEASAITAGAWDRFASATAARDNAASRRESLRSEADGLLGMAAVADRDARTSEAHMATALREGRSALWNAVDHKRGYAVGSDVLAHAMRLTDYTGVTDSVALRELRVQAVQRLSSEIHAGEPALVIRAATAPHPVPTYQAGVAEHDGFGVSMIDDSDNGTNHFVLSFNGDPVATLNDAVHVTPGFMHGETFDEPEASSPLTVVSGEQVSRFIHEGIATDAATLVSSEPTLEEALAVPYSQRNDLYCRKLQATIAHRREDMIGLIEAAEASSVPLEFPDELQQDIHATLCTYLLDTGDTHPGTGVVVRIGRALQAVYPNDAPVPLQEYLIQKSNERFGDSYGLRRHRVSPVVTVLQQVCSMNGSIPPHLRLQ